MNLQDILFIVISVIFGTIALALFGIVFGLLYKGIDRKISAHMQGRIGPPIIQPFRDVRKLFTKENIIPENAIPWIFNLAPIVGLISSIALLLYLPVGGLNPLAGGLIGDSAIYGDLILILYLLIIPSLAMVLGGFASGSPYATVGAQREMATMIAYEFPLAIIIVSFAWLLNTLNVDGLLTNPGPVFSFVTITQNPIWMNVGIFGFIGAIILLFVLVLVTPAELSKIPFDSPEAETEIAGGLFTEYSGRNLGLFYLADGVKTIALATIVVALFFPWNLSSLIGVEGLLGIGLDIVFYLLKIFLVILFSVTLIRVAIARLKIDQIVYTYWVWITLMALVGLILIMWDRQFGLQTIANLIGLS